jgi:hypothetical protein
MGWRDAPEVAAPQAKPKWMAAPEISAPAFVPSGEKSGMDWTSPESIAGNPVTRFALGAAAPVLGAAQLQANIHPLARMIGADKAVNEKLQQLEQMKKEGRVNLGSEGFDWTEAVGNVFSPAIIGMAKAIPGGLTYLQKVLTGAGAGAAAGASTPVTTGSNDADFAKEKATQTGIGATVGGVVSGVVPAVEAIGRGAKNLVEPLFNPAAAKGRVFLEAAGDKADEIIAMLRQNKEIVPWSSPTAGEAAAGAGSAEFSALQKQAAAIRPTEYAAREAEQNAARISSLQTVGKDKAAIESAEKVRSAAAGPLYKAAREGTAPVDTAPILAKIDTILEKNPGNRELVTELSNVRKGLAESGTEAQKIASVIDGLKATLANKDNAFIKGTLTDIKNSLSRSIPGYERAQQVYAKGSEPINQMQIGQYLEQKLVPALSDEAKQKAATYAGAVQDAAGTIKRSTGAPRFDELTKALTPEQMNVVNGIRDDLARSARMDVLAQKGAKAAPDISTAMQAPKVTGVLERTVTIANSIISRLEGRINKRVAAEIAAEMLNPPKVAETLAQAKARASVNSVLSKDVERAIRQGTAAGIQQNE